MKLNEIGKEIDPHFIGGPLNGQTYPENQRNIFLKMAPYMVFDRGGDSLHMYETKNDNLYFVESRLKAELLEELKDRPCNSK